MSGRILAEAWVGTVSQSDNTPDGQMPFSDSILALLNMCFMHFWEWTYYTSGKMVLVSGYIVSAAMGLRA